MYRVTVRLLVHTGLQQNGPGLTITSTFSAASTGHVVLDYFGKNAAAGRKTKVDAYLRHMVMERKALWATERCLSAWELLNAALERCRGPQSSGGTELATIPHPDRCQYVLRHER